MKMGSPTLCQTVPQVRSWVDPGRGTLLFSCLIFLACLFGGATRADPAHGGIDMGQEEKRVSQWRKERDQLFKTHQRSPLSDKAKRAFTGLAYYPFNPDYVFEGHIERFVFRIDDPRYYATFLTNRGVNKRYVRYGKFHFEFEGKEYALEVYKSILSDTLFIPFRDKTNGKETYEAGRYVDAEILPGYRMVLDFNMAYFPSCAYNSTFVCVLPPKENTLSAEIRAGERNPK